ncbi:MAG: PEP-utilizing enzyme [Candidatus Staskawiczbacteria bacterium]|jgi:phosphohistidine swiveling domain-containing protein/transcriptional regulator with XRE-family HTH domain
MVDKKIIKIIRQSNYWKAEGPALMKLCEAPVMGFANIARYNKGLKYSPIFFFTKKGYGYQFLDEQDSVNVIAFHINKGEKYIDSRIKLWADFEKKTFLSASIIDKIDLSDLSNKELWNLYDAFHEYLINTWCVAMFLEGNGIYFEKALIPKICKETGLSESEAASKAAILTTPEKQSFSKKEHISLLKIALEFLKNNVAADIFLEDLKNKHAKIYKLLNNHQKSFYWVRNNYKNVTKITEDEFLKEVKNISNGKDINAIKSELSRAQDVEKLENKKTEIRKSLKISKELEKEIKIFSVFGWWHDERKRINLHSLQYIFIFLDEIAKRMGLTFRQINNITNKEVKDFLISGNKLDIKEIKERENMMLYILFDNQKFNVCSGREAEEYFNEILKSTGSGQKNEKELKGYVACSGGKDKVQGKVSLILDVKKEKFEEGTILVTSMTRPEFVPIMKKAKAVITSEGGITSHAAIVSREFNIPCIIGTKIATTFFKTGDNIEMDLSKGTIKILK